MNKTILYFDKPLEKALILNRPNRFVMFVKTKNGIKRCFCPTPTKIGNILFKNIPCYLSKNLISSKTIYTVEALALSNRKIIGINQNKINDLYFTLISRGAFRNIFKTSSLTREVALGKNRIDFASENCFIEIKMPLTVLPFKKPSPLTNLAHKGRYERTISQYQELIKEAKKGKKCFVFITYLYDAPNYNPYKQNKSNKPFLKTIEKAEKEGVSFIQNNFQMNDKRISLKKSFKLSFLNLKGINF